MIDHDADAERPFLVTEFCAGGTLREIRTIAEGDVAIGLSLFLQLCDGLAAAHEAGIVHRDVKPGNMFLRSNGTAVVADFGLCHFQGGKRLTLTREVVGPAFFIAPELEDGRTDIVLPASDVYSLGKLLYWILSGGEVFSREKHRHPTFNLVHVLADERMEKVNRLLDRMIVADPLARFGNASIVAQEARALVPLLASAQDNA